MPQTEITDSPARAYAGMLADSSFDDVVTATVQTAAGIAAGLCVSRNSTDEWECKAPASAADLTSQTILGVVIRDVAREPGVFAQYAEVSILRKGRVWVTIEDAFTAGGSIYVRKTAGVGESLGAFRASEDSTDMVRVPGVILTNGDAGDLGMIEINFPYPQEVDELAESTVDSGTFTPTGTNGTNTTAFANLFGWYIRIGAIVHFTIQADVTHTAGAPTASTAEFSLPVASNFAAATDAGGTVTGDDVDEGHITANSTNDRLVANYLVNDTGAQKVVLTGSYTVI